MGKNTPFTLWRFNETSPAEKKTFVLNFKIQHVAENHDVAKVHSISQWIELSCMKIDQTPLT